MQFGYVRVTRGRIRVDVRVLLRHFESNPYRNLRAEVKLSVAKFHAATDV